MANILIIDDDMGTYGAFAKIDPNVKILFMSGYTSNAIIYHGIMERV